MASIFISYSSRDERAAVGLRTWLGEHDYKPVLVTRTKKQERGDFEALKAELKDEIGRADIVIFLLTPFWQASDLCQWEMAWAKSTSAMLLAIQEAPTSRDLSNAMTVVDMTKGRDAALVELKDRLKRYVQDGQTGAGAKWGRSKPVLDADTAEDVGLQGNVIADHGGSVHSINEKSKRRGRPARGGEARVNRTLKILRQGIRWNTFPEWFIKTFKMSEPRAHVKKSKPKEASSDKSSFNLPKFQSLTMRAASWVVADKLRVTGAAFLLFVLTTALIGLTSDRTFIGKDAMRKELANVKKRQSLLLSRVANHLRESGDQETALLLALEAMNEAQEQDDLQQARDSLYTAWVKTQKKLVLRGHDNHVSGAMFSPDGKYILSSSWDRTARVWEVSSRRQVLVLDKHDGFVNGAVYSPDQSMILTAALDNKARLFNARTGRLIRILKGHSHDLTSAVFSANGRRVVTASGDQTARVWDVAGGKLLRTFLGHKAGLEYASFSPDGNRIVTASADSTARILDVTSGEQLSLLKGHTDVVRSARYDPKGNLIATASEDKTVRLWEARSGVFQRALKGHEWAVLTASFSPDGQRIVTASKDNTARLWSVKTGKLLLVLKGHKGIVSQASFSPDGRQVVTSSGDGTIRLWPLVDSDQELVKKAQRAATRCLTLPERKKYFLGNTPPDWCIKLKKRPYNK